VRAVPCFAKCCWLLARSSLLPRTSANVILVADARSSLCRTPPDPTMRLDFNSPGKVKINMTVYVKSMIKDFPEEVQKSNYPWNDNLYKINDKDIKLDTKTKETFHTFVAKGLFLCKRGRPDIQPSIAFLSTRVRSPGQQDWFKLTKLMEFLKSTEDDVLTLSCDGSQNIIWYVDAAFGVHHDMKNHTRATMTLGDGAIQSYSTKQKINTRSSTESELVSIDDVISKIIWTKLFLQAQGFHVKENIINRDNQSSMKLEMNGKNSSGKLTRHFNIKYFNITDLIARKEATIQFCPTDEMISDYMTKPTSGAKFHQFRSAILNLEKNVGSDSRSVLGNNDV
jgi:hypothetical protein